MAKIYKLCMQTFEAAKHEDGREYVKEEYKCGKWHTCPEECIYDNLHYIIAHPGDKFTLIEGEE